ncbi:hypothetical protein HZC31_05960 [Candidatus Woesearchaeota archaeon]|nr:hypothetical protein [Candidatus Woesearchaeota archaeon]
MSLKRNIIDGAMLLSIVLAVATYLFFQNFLVAFILFVIAITVGWFRRALYRVIPSH